MALPMLRGCSRLPSTLSFTRLFLSESPVLNRSGRRRLPPRSAAAVAASVRPYSSEQDKRKLNKLVFVGIPNPFIYFRVRIYYFLIRIFFDKDFNIEELAEGAKQAFSHVSRLLSECQFDALEGLVAEDLIGKLKEKCSSLPSDYKEALSADPDDIKVTTLGDVGIFYDVNGRKFVCILMHFLYLTSAQLPDEIMEGTRLFEVVTGDGEEPKTKRLLSAIYEFQREFTKGVPPDWTITRIEHSKLLD